jgi:uncharacterized protein
MSKIVWTDLTVPDAESVRDFYAAVAGWKPEPVPMKDESGGEYADYNMTDPASGEPVVGVCHARGGNAGMPAQWLLYVSVEDLDASMAACREQGGEVVHGPRDMGSHGRFCVVQDPAGAVLGLIEPAS